MNVKNKHILDSIIWAKTDSPKDIFNRIYEKNLWYSKETVSGKGSQKTAVRNILRMLPELFSELNIKTILDSPCGDYSWMKEIDYTFEKYTGVDIVENLIKDNILKYGNTNISFNCLDIIKDDMPKVDLILCRDCFIHLSYKNIFKAVRNFKNTNSKYLLTTTYKNVKENTDIFNGGFRKINLLLPPFNFSSPEIEIPEEDDKVLSLWRIEDL